MQDPNDGSAPYEALGRLTVAFCQVETILHAVVWAIVKPTDMTPGYSVTQDLGFEAVVDLLQRLQRNGAVPPARQSSVTDLIPALRGLGARYDAFTHRLYAPSAATDVTPARVHEFLGDVAAGRTSLLSVHVTAEEVHQAARDCDRVRQSLGLLLLALRDA